mgnify:CR=1 FL=1
MIFKRITIDPNILNGKPCIRGMRFPVHQILDLTAAGKSFEDILNDYPYLESDDVKEALEYGSWLAKEESFSIPSLAH